MLKPAGAALITGGAKRLGRALALHLASQGYDIALHCHRSRSEAEALIPVVASFGRRLEILSADLSVAEAAENTEVLLEQAFQHFPALNILLNNASAFFPVSFAETTSAQWDQFYHLHVKTPFFLIQAFARRCQAGLVVNMTDAQAPQPDYFAYGLSKQNLADMTRLAARSLGPQLRVNAIAPGYILAPVAGNPDNAADIRAQIPLQRTGAVQDITQALQVFLDNPYLTGQTLYVDGGLNLL
ncbi:MAG: SDR family oxidoreductase [Candidatus Sericytochromatia bacterium]